MKVGITAEAPGAEINSSLEAFGQICHCWTFVPNLKVNLEEILFSNIVLSTQH